MKNQDTSQLTNRLREITGGEGAIEWNEQTYPTETRNDAQQAFIDQLRNDAKAIEQELESRKK